MHPPEASIGSIKIWGSTLKPQSRTVGWQFFVLTRMTTSQASMLGAVHLVPCLSSQWCGPRGVTVAPLLCGGNLFALEELGSAEAVLFTFRCGGGASLPLSACLHSLPHSLSPFPVLGDIYLLYLQAAAALRPWGSAWRASAATACALLGPAQFL